jgi:hypothetical protein
MSTSTVEASVEGRAAGIPAVAAVANDLNGFESFVRGKPKGVTVLVKKSGDVFAISDATIFVSSQRATPIVE